MRGVTEGSAVLTTVGDLGKGGEIVVGGGGSYV